ncbi:hypothetical protein B0T09DRAFT_325644 [Sordaria sp. MPI-SDFR-AT-0083]|nr:hypothetical protein B0T09DRAFT_325644 [Sordaria sp. MPI-SDFR-AT-0083]
MNPPRTPVDRDAKEAKQAKHLISQPPPECQSFTRLASLAPSPFSRHDAGEPNQMRMRGKWMQVEEGGEEERPLLLLWCLVRKGVFVMLTCIVACKSRHRPGELARDRQSWLTVEAETCCAAQVNHGGWRLVLTAGDTPWRTLLLEFDRSGLPCIIPLTTGHILTKRSRDGLQSGLRRGIRSVAAHCDFTIIR